MLTCTFTPFYDNFHLNNINIKSSSDNICLSWYFDYQIFVVIFYFIHNLTTEYVHKRKDLILICKIRKCVKRIRIGVQIIQIVWKVVNICHISFVYADYLQSKEMLFHVNNYCVFLISLFQTFLRNFLNEQGSNMYWLLTVMCGK